MKKFWENHLENLRKKFSLLSPLSLSLGNPPHTKKKKKAFSIFACNFVGKLVGMG